MEAKIRQIGVQKELIVEIQKEIEELKTLNKSLQLDADEKNAAVQEAKALKSQQEILVKENADLKAVLLGQESDQSKPNPDEQTGTSSGKKAQILEEIREMLANVIYAYKTLSSNMKELKDRYGEKKLKLTNLLDRIKSINQVKKKEEFMAIIKLLEGQAIFLKGMPDKVKNMKLIISCLNEMSIAKKNKVKFYNDEILRCTEAIDVSESKINEYEDKLSLYC